MLSAGPSINRTVKRQLAAGLLDESLGGVMVGIVKRTFSNSGFCGSQPRTAQMVLCPVNYCEKTAANCHCHGKLVAKIQTKYHREKLIAQTVKLRRPNDCGMGF
jgi:hypothetical protein